uniref:Uncharacterized protein n=1 Tax=Rhipicephalus appendiculatus TaxID=34631 RepID=A0A131YHK1_RHIAP
MNEAQQLIASATNEIVPLTHSAMLSEGRVTGRPAHDISHECALIGAGLCASAFEEEMPRTSEVLFDYRFVYTHAHFLFIFLIIIHPLLSFPVLLPQYTRTGTYSSLQTFLSFCE